MHNLGDISNTHLRQEEKSEGHTQYANYRRGFRSRKIS